MKAIYRYPIEFKLEQDFFINGLVEDGKFVLAKEQVLKVDVIRGIPSIWFMVNKNAPKINVKLYLFGTGWEIPEDIKKKDYLGSFIMDNAEIYHIFMENI